MSKLKVLDLFSGIGGFSLGLERTGGFETKAFCEIEPFCRRVLAKHWPDVFIHDDIRTLTKDTLCSGYAENALLNQLCREMGGNLQSAKLAITNIRRAAEQRTRRATTLGQLSAEDELSNIMGAVAPVAGSENTRFWQSITNLITATRSEQHTRALYGNSLSSEDFQTIIKFFVTTAIWRNLSTAPARINETLRANGYDDVRTLTADRLRADGIAVDVICGGFPCQDISDAGYRAGIFGERSSLWFEFARLIGEVRPHFVIVENVAELLHRGLAEVLGSLAALGYDAEWHVIGAAHIGADHIRERLWVCAYPQSIGCDGRRGTQPQAPLLEVSGLVPKRNRSWTDAASGFGALYGVPNRLDRLRGLGNAVCPDIPHLIGNAILASLARQEAA